MRSLFFRSVVPFILGLVAFGSGQAMALENCTDVDWKEAALCCDSMDLGAVEHCAVFDNEVQYTCTDGDSWLALAFGECFVVEDPDLGEAPSGKPTSGRPDPGDPGVLKVTPPDDDPEADCIRDR